MSTLFIHIGPSKTASSFLQSVLPSLQSEDRFRPLGFPTSPTGKANWSLLASLFDPDNTLISNKEFNLMDIDKPLEFLLLKLQKGDQLISGEQLGDMESIGFHNLKEIIKPHKLRVLLFARTYELRSLSLWQESIKWGETNSFHDFLTSQVCSVESVKKLESITYTNRP